MICAGGLSVNWSAWLGEPNLFRSVGRCRLPIHRAIHDLPHLCKPPLCAAQTARRLNVDLKSACVVEAEFQLLLSNHNLPFIGAHFNGLGWTKTVQATKINLDLAGGEKLENAR